MQEPESLPHSIDAELGLLCSLCLNREALRDCASVPSEVFYLPAHQVVFGVLRDMEAANRAIDFNLVKIELASDDRLEDIGGIEVLLSIWRFSHVSDNWKEYLSHVTSAFQKRVAIQACKELIDRLQSGEDNAVGAINEVVESTLSRMRLRVVKPEKTFKELVYEAIDELDRRASSTGLSGVGFGIKSLDMELLGVQPSEVCVIAAHPGYGKSALAGQAVCYTAQTLKKSSAIFSLEMTSTRQVLRMFSHVGEISMSSIKSGRLTEYEIPRHARCVAEMMSWTICIEDQFCSDINMIVSRCRQLKAKHNIALVVVDYLQLVEGSRRKADNRQLEVAEVSRRLKVMAGELDVAVIALSQLNDEGRLRESRAIGQDADIVLKILDSKSDESGAMELEISKQRDGQFGRKIPVRFYGKYMKFEDVEAA
jgi:replicative DNA helicase